MRRASPLPLGAVYVGLAIASSVALALDPPAKGWAVLACVVAFNVAVPLVARATRDAELLRAWAFLLALSVFQVLPDWALVVELGTLRFPDNGGPRLGGDVIPLAMGGQWVIALLPVVLLARGSAVRGALLALAVFTGSELIAPVLDLWEPVPGASTEVAGIALYVLPAEMVLGGAAVLAHEATRDRPLAQRVAAAAGVATLYTGALVLAHLLLDTASLSLQL